MGNIFNEDFRDFIKAPNDNQVDYILVGGYSVALHGYPRTTGDMDILVSLVLCLLSFTGFSQYDTNYVKKYNNRLVVSYFQSERSYNLTFQASPPSVTTSSLSTTSNYIAQANKVSGFSFDYDKISFSLGWKTPLPETDIYKKGKTDYSAFNFSFSGSKYRLESSYRRYQGFYDQNTPVYDTLYNDSLPYYQDPSLVTRSFKVKGFYFMNKKRRFSYSSSYSNTSRQVKTAGSFLLVGNIYSLLMYSSSAIIPPVIQPFYGPWGNVNYFNLFGLSCGAGYTFNKVLWKKFFLNLTLTLGLEAQHRYYKSNDAIFNEKDWMVSFAALDGRLALGYNARNFFVSFTSMNDYNSYNMKTMKFNVSYLSASFNIGYRFRLKEYAPIKAMKENKYYQMF